MLTFILDQLIGLILWKIFLNTESAIAEDWLLWGCGGCRGRVAVHFSSSRLSSASICGFAFLPLVPPAPYRYFDKPPYHWISAVACLSFLRHLCFLPSCVFVNVFVCVCVYSERATPQSNQSQWFNVSHHHSTNTRACSEFQPYQKYRWAGNLCQQTNREACERHRGTPRCHTAGGHLRPTQGSTRRLAQLGSSLILSNHGCCRTIGKFRQLGNMFVSWTHLLCLERRLKNQKDLFFVSFDKQVDLVIPSCKYYVEQNWS